MLVTTGNYFSFFLKDLETGGAVQACNLPTFATSTLFLPIAEVIFHSWHLFDVISKLFSKYPCISFVLQLLQRLLFSGQFMKQMICIKTHCSFPFINPISLLVTFFKHFFQFYAVKVSPGGRYLFLSKLYIFVIYTYVIIGSNAFCEHLSCAFLSLDYKTSSFIF